MLNRRQLRSTRACIGCLLLSQGAAGLQVFLTSIAIYSSRRVERLEGPLSVYFTCVGGEHVHLTDVQATFHRYSWPQEDRLVTTITAGSCKTCSFFEDRSLPLKSDDLIGDAFELCEADFHGEPGVSQPGWTSRGSPQSFEADFYCKDCIPPSPSPTPSPPPLPSASPEPSPARSQAPAPGPSGLPQLPPPAAGLPDAPASTSPQQDGHGRGLPAGAIAGIVIGTLAAGFAAGGMTCVAYRRWRKARKRQRQRAFEAVFSEPDTALEMAPMSGAVTTFNWRNVVPYSWVRLPEDAVT